MATLTRSGLTSHSKLDEKHEQFFQSLFQHDPSGCILSDADALEYANTDWTTHYKGESSILLRPKSVDQLSEVMKYCQAESLAVVPQGGKTGLVGGSVPVRHEVIVSMSRMNQIEGLDEVNGILKCQAGCILSNLQEYCAARNHLVPVDLGSKGTCQIGGNISTNAGGQYYYRYGSLAGNVLGLQVVLANGSLLDLNYTRTNIKDNTGYKLHQLFVGAEGTLGIVTGVALLCPRSPLSRKAMFVACQTYDQVLQVLASAKRLLGEILAAFEWMDDTIVDLVGRQLTLPIKNGEGDTFGHKYAILIETHGSCEEHDEAKMEKFLETVMNQGLVADGALAQDLMQLESFWRIRESANPTVAAMGYGYKYDISLPCKEFSEFIEVMQSRLNGLDVIQTNWGHIMDGNLHFNVTTPGRFEKDDDVSLRLEPFVFSEVLRRHGSISAEHGIGRQKKDYLTQVHSSATLQMMRELKNLFDQKGILNPGKYLP